MSVFLTSLLLTAINSSIFFRESRRRNHLKEKWKTNDCSIFVSYVTQVIYAALLEKKTYTSKSRSDYQRIGVEIFANVIK